MQPIQLHIDEFAPKLAPKLARPNPAVAIAARYAPMRSIAAPQRATRMPSLVGVTGGFVAAPEIEAEPLIEDEIVIVGARNFEGGRLTRDHLYDLSAGTP